MKVEDYYVQKRRGWVRLHEKGRQGDRASLPSQPGPVPGRMALCIRAWRRTGSSTLPFPALRPAHRPHSPAPGQCAPYDPAQSERRKAENEASAPTAFAQPASLPTCRTAASWRSPSRWPATNQPAPLASTTGAAMISRSMKSSGSLTERHAWCGL